MAQHDEYYKAIFTYPEIIAQLLQSFIKQDWVNEVDFSTLEKSNGHYVTDDNRKRSDDIVWKVRWKAQDLYIYLLLEFQSEPDYFMPVRMMTYIGLLYQDLIASLRLKAHDKLPPVLPIVLHRGLKQWNYPNDIQDLIAKPSEVLARYSPRLSFCLIDECQYDSATLMKIDNAVALLFQLEKQDDILSKAKQVARLSLLVKHSPALESVFRNWVEYNLALRLENPDVFKQARNLEEMAIMLSECVDSWVTQWKNEGLLTGMIQGRQEGRLEGEALVLRRQLCKRFGELPEWVELKLANSSMDDLENWAIAVLDAKTLEAVFLLKG
jgi:predicted transposase/invertase (TIGR01784 family)